MARNRSEQPAAEAAFEIDNDDAPQAPASTEASEPSSEAGQPGPAEPQAAPAPPPLELVTEPGPKKRIVFEGSAPERQPAADTPAPAAPATPERQPSYREAPSSASTRPAPRSRDDLEDIHSRIDMIGRPDPRFEGRPSRANLEPLRTSTRSRTLYTTAQGNEVRIYDGPNPTLTLTQRRGERIEERAFDERLVDQAIGRGPADGDRQATSEERGWDASLTEQAPSSPVTPSEGEARPKRRFGLFGRRKQAAETGQETVVPLETASPAAAPAAVPQEPRHFRPVTVEQESAVEASSRGGHDSGEGWDPSEGHASASGSMGADSASAATRTETRSSTRTTKRTTSRSSSRAAGSTKRSSKKETSSKRAAETAGRKRSR